MITLHTLRLFGSTGPGQHSPLVVTFAGGQHLPLAVGMPDAQHCGPIGMRTILSHWLLFGPLGACPAGQQIPVEVSLLARQHELPVET
jgi:hypothetical protein